MKIFVIYFSRQDLDIHTIAIFQGLRSKHAIYIAKRFDLAMKLTNSKWNDNIYYWKREFPTCVPKVPKNKD